MAKKFDPNLKQLLEKYTNEDGTIDYDKVSEHITEDVTKYHQGQMPNMEELEAQARDNAINNFLKAEGFDNVDQYKAHVKRLNADSTELTEANKRLEEELNKFKTDYTSLETNYNELNTKLTGMERQSKINEFGFNSKYTNAILSETNSLVNDDTPFEKALETVKENYPEWATDFKPDKGNQLDKTDNNEPDDVKSMLDIWG